MELLITIAILAIGTSIAIPSYQSFTINSRLRQASTNINEAIVLARNEAVKRGVVINLVPRVIGQWDKGWNVELTDTTIIRQFDSLTNLTMTNINALNFLATGIRSDANLPQFTFNICHPSGKGVTLQVNVTGGIKQTEIKTACAI